MHARAAGRGRRQPRGSGAARVRASSDVKKTDSSYQQPGKQPASNTPAEQDRRGVSAAAWQRWRVSAGWGRAAAPHRAGSARRCMCSGCSLRSCTLPQCPCARKGRLSRAARKSPSAFSAGDARRRRRAARAGAPAEDEEGQPDWGAQARDGQLARDLRGAVSDVEDAGAQAIVLRHRAVSAPAPTRPHEAGRRRRPSGRAPWSTGAGRPRTAGRRRRRCCGARARDIVTTHHAHHATASSAAARACTSGLCT